MSTIFFPSVKYNKKTVICFSENVTVHVGRKIAVTFSIPSNVFVSEILANTLGQRDCDVFIVLFPCVYLQNGCRFER
jgi:hypothetical protein